MAPLVPIEHLAAIGFTDPARAARILESLSGGGVPDELVEQLLPALLNGLRKSPDPDRALINFDRWTQAVTGRYTHFQLLTRHPVALEIFLNVCGTSQLFSDILIRNPEYFEILANPGVRSGARSGGELYRELSNMVGAIVRPELKLEAMRRFKQREFLRIGVRDILGLADMPATAREFSNLADACVQKCLEIETAVLEERYGIESPPFAVFAMGKLGGQELNYSSDIDLLFVTDDRGAATPQDRNNHPDLEPSTFNLQPSTTAPIDFAQKLSERVIAALARNLENGHLFRVDMRLRPEGRFGPLVRTLDSYRSYYESWAEPWERQALLKARFVGGDVRLGRAFREMFMPYIYRRSVTSDFVESIRANKRRIEQKAELEGQSRTNVKVGIGGIRDVEFTVQLLQLEIGGRNPRLRTPNTLEALARLSHAGIIGRDEAEELSEDYQFLRTVEHRLQILYELQTQELPTEAGERRLLARRLGYRDTPEFDEEYLRRTERVHAHFLRLFYGEERESGASPDPWPDLLQNVEAPEAGDAIQALLRGAGFHDPKGAYAILRTAAAGGEYGRARPESLVVVQQLACPLVASCARTGDPDAAFAGMEALALAAPNRAALYGSLLEGVELRDRLCTLGAGSPELIQSLARNLEWLDMLVSEEVLEPDPKPVEEHHQDLASRLKDRTGDAFWQALATYIRRERLRIGARDVWGDVDALVVARELSNLADAVIEALLGYGIAAVCARFPSEETHHALEAVAIFGLGKLGGREVGYRSDWDILIIYRESPARPLASSPARPIDVFPALNSLAELLLSAGQELRTRDAPVELDARLRPEGRFGALARSVDSVRAYYTDQALTWEKQTLVKARYVAGNPETAAAYRRVVDDVIYGHPLPAKAQEEIRAMKRRIEHERLKPAERFTDLKLGHGGMSDIEFTVQLHQLRVGAEHPEARVTPTVDALHALAGLDEIPAPEALRLEETYTLLLAVRNRLSLLTGTGINALPSDESRLRAVAVGLGFADTAEQTAQHAFRRHLEDRMRETRQIVDRLFYTTP